MLLLPSYLAIKLFAATSDIFVYAQVPPGLIVRHQQQDLNPFNSKSFITYASQVCKIAAL
jgi:hypothetical protein